MGSDAARLYGWISRGGEIRRRRAESGNEMPWIDGRKQTTSQVSDCKVAGVKGRQVHGLLHVSQAKLAAHWYLSVESWAVTLSRASLTSHTLHVSFRHHS
jgi:hypothetical protein